MKSIIYTNMYAGRKRIRASSAGGVPNKKQKRSYTRVRVPRLLTPTTPSRSQSYHCKLIYADQFTFNTGVGGGTLVQVMAANGLYDVDITGTGHQPAGFDQLMTLWNEYIVVASKIKVVFKSQDTNNYSAVFGIAFEDFGTTVNDYRRYIENGQCVWNIVGPVGAEPKTLEMTKSIREASRQDIYNEDNFSGTVSTNPTDTHYWHVFFAPLGSWDTGDFYAVIEVEYDVYFRDPALAVLS